MAYEDRHQEKLQKIQHWKIKRLFNRFLLLAFAGATVFGGWKWLASTTSSSSPGQSIADLGRKHVPAGTTVEYNSNPPTSGPHYEQWEKAGIYDRPLTDEKLVHSLEHGYVIVSYNCTKQSISDFRFKISGFVQQSYAHKTEEPHEEPATESGESLVSWKDDPECQSLVSELERIAKKLGLKKLILVPRSNLDSRIALTAWTHLDKFDDPDENRITRFTNAYRNKGPEKTME